ncbi:MAG TPA: hypothetical protein DCQ64_30145 [Candidatus Rokubacteria bacterium]|nr:hypothetical protein [Candidatus Rokubacteria bacterium]
MLETIATAARRRPTILDRCMAVRKRPRGKPLPGLLAVRESKLLTQQQLAELTGVERSTIARIELGGAARLSTIKALVEALAVEPEELMRLPA